MLIKYSVNVVCKDSKDYYDYGGMIKCDILFLVKM